MKESKDLQKYMDDFNKIILDLKNVNVHTDKEDQCIILLSPLMKTYEHIIDTMLYWKKTLMMTEVKSVLISKELERKSEIKEEKNGDMLLVRGRSKARKEKINKKCYLCHKEGHFKRNCPNREKYKELNPKKTLTSQ
ncbi:hypothetical protein KFK09_028937 [Dendrobium nobile]|uniref:CCHC-type domain-containing protein n=1 Tax=Dendrobium nobile TaxID=94219 RepID=A0A8T3A431_DENNO|nr:hypothetical protein KFK09_028937 [Dendrobium nobile]